jgi:hypothetical protein
MKLNKEDFILVRHEALDGHDDYWFNVIGDESRKELEDNYWEMCMVGITEVVYSKDEDMVGIKQLFPFNFNVVMSDDTDLKTILKELSE